VTHVKIRNLGGAGRLIGKRRSGYTFWPHSTGNAVLFSKTGGTQGSRSGSQSRGPHFVTGNCNTQAKYRNTLTADRDTLTADRDTLTADRVTAVADRNTSIKDGLTLTADRDTPVAELNTSTVANDEGCIRVNGAY
jgi:hypothetical protein